MKRITVWMVLCLSTLLLLTSCSSEKATKGTDAVFDNGSISITQEEMVNAIAMDGATEGVQGLMERKALASLAKEAGFDTALSEEEYQDYKSTIKEVFGEATSGKKPDAFMKKFEDFAVYWKSMESYYLEVHAVDGYMADQMDAYAKKLAMDVEDSGFQKKWEKEKARIGQAAVDKLLSKEERNTIKELASKLSK